MSTRSDHGRLPDQEARKATVRGDTGEVVAFPYLPRVVGADKPPGWTRWSKAEKVEHLLGMALDRIHDCLAWPPDQLDMRRLAAQAQVIRVTTMVAAKAGVEAHREREQSAALEALARALRRTAPHPRHRPRCGENRASATTNHFWKSPRASTSPSGVRDR